MPRAATDALASPRATRPALRARRLFTEVFGTFLLVLVDAGGAMVAALSADAVTPVARSLATGLLIMAMIYTMGDVSGAHFNPAVTFAFALRRAFPWSRVPEYWLAQLTGAFAAAALLLSLFGPVESLGATLPSAGFGNGQAVIMEVLLTLMLVSVILGTASRHRIVGSEAALAVGGTIALCSLFSRPVSGASMNPARSLAPAALGGQSGTVWIYLVGPFIGATLAVLFMMVIHHRRHRNERLVAEGVKKK